MAVLSLKKTRSVFRNSIWILPLQLRGEGGHSVDPQEIPWDQS